MEVKNFYSYILCGMFEKTRKDLVDKMLPDGKNINHPINKLYMINTMCFPDTFQSKYRENRWPELF